MARTLILVLLAGAPQAGPTITVDPGTAYQTISGWEAVDFALNDDARFPGFIDAVLDGVVEAGLNRVRLEIKSGAENTQDYWTLYQTGQIDYATWRANRYATVNDDSDPNTINWSGFHFASLDWNVDHIITPLRNKLAAQGVTLQVNLCYVAFTGQITTGQYHHSNAAEYAEFVLATNLHLRNKYGWVPDFWEVILEPDNVSQWNTGTVLGNAMVASANRLTANGITPRFVAPATTNMTNASTYFDAMLAVPGAIQDLEEIAYHRYAGVSQAALQNVAARAVQHGKNASMLEWWSGGNSHQTLHEDLKVGRNSAWQSGSIAGDGTGPTAFMQVVGNPPVVSITDYAKFIRQYWKFVKRGARRIGASSASGTFDPLAFVNADGKHVLVVKASGGGSFAVQGLPAGTYGLKYTTGSQYDVDLADATVAAGQPVNASIPAAGVLTVYGKTATPSPGTIQFSQAAYSSGEGAGAATITATRTGGSAGPLSASYSTSNGTATAADYAAASGTLVWADGDSAPKTFTVSVLDDVLVEGSETVQLTMGSSTATLTILDDDVATGPPGTIQFSAAAYSVGEAGGSATITATRTGGSAGQLSASYATSNGSASAADYGPASGTLTWVDGDTSPKTFSVPIVNDTLVESSETVQLTLGTSSATLTIVDDDTAGQPGTIQFSAASYSAGEASGQATITAQRVGGSAGPLSAAYSTANGTATAADYTAASGTFTWADGDASPRTFTVPIANDALVEGNETVQLLLGSASAVLTIVDDDAAAPPPPVVPSNGDNANGDGWINDRCPGGIIRSAPAPWPLLLGLACLLVLLRRGR
jgi:hypothetical protein